MTAHAPSTAAPADLTSRLEAKKREALPFTDVGNGHRLVLDHHDDIRYVVGAGWHVWDGARWRRDDSKELDRRAKATTQLMREEAARLPEGYERDALWAHAQKSERHDRIRAMQAMAASDLDVIVRADDLDKDPLAFNVMNGTIDLRTGELHPHHREDLLTRLAPVVYDSTAECPTWLSFLDRIFAGDGDLVAYVQRAVGYSLTGSTREQVLFIPYGVGANGKTKFSETLAGLSGDYSAAADPGTFTASRGQGIPNDLARLRGARYVKTVETEEGAKLARQLIKRITGEDTVSARFLYGEWFEFKPQFKLFLVTNHLPQIPGTDKAAWRRIRVIPFEVRIPHEEQDRDLGEKLLEELTGILNWAIEGCLAWQRDGLGMPQAVKEATGAYRAQHDTVGRFLAERCAEAHGESVIFSRLLAAYTAFCRELGLEALESDQFAKALTAAGYPASKTTGGVRVRRGLTL